MPSPKPLQRSSALTLIFALAAVMLLGALTSAPPAYAAQESGSEEWIGDLPGPWQANDQEVQAAAVELPWCDTVLPRRSGDTRRAEEIMDGHVDMGIYGDFRLEDTPSWGYKSSLDSSGNGHVHGLHWAVPLLRAGISDDRPDMVKRFEEIVVSWLKRFPYRKHNRPGSANVGIVVGERLMALTCAAESVPNNLINKQIRAEAEGVVRSFGITSGTNNVAIHAQTGAASALCLLDGAGAARTPINNLRRLAKYLILPDGSDREGSPHYARYTRIVLEGSNRVAKTCRGREASAITKARTRVERFLAAAATPAFTLETLGDTAHSELTEDNFDADSPAKYAASQGAEGTPPPSGVQYFQGGYALGRDQNRGTFYSVRTSQGPSPTAHTHNDVASVTFHADGVEWLGDPGPYRYSYGSALRRHVVTRAAHSAFTVTPLRPKLKDHYKNKKARKAAKKARRNWKPPTSRAAGKLKGTARSSARAITCVQDDSYPTIRLKRCVTYDKQTTRFMVTDTVKARERSDIFQRWQLPPEVSAERTDTGAVLSGVDAITGEEAVRDLSIDASGGKWELYRAHDGAPYAWFTVRYGLAEKGSLLKRSLRLEKGQKATWVTTLSPSA
ncbi:MAG: heparinase II/III family protein [Actinobacteria bacterium]|nr:heparinase II/III family protein [Actinomycetota bacterium]